MSKWVSGNNVVNEGYRTSPLMDALLQGFKEALPGGLVCLEVRRKATDENVRDAAYYEFQKRKLVGVPDTPENFASALADAQAQLADGNIVAFAFVHAIYENRVGIAAVHWAVAYQTHEEGWEALARALAELKGRDNITQVEVYNPNWVLMYKLKAQGFEQALDNPRVFVLK